MSPINHSNPIKLYPDGSMWCALVGPNLQEGEAGFGRSPAEALDQLLSNEDVWAQVPHAVYEMQCDRCEHDWVAVAPYPMAESSLECPKCQHMNPVDQDGAATAND